MRALAGGVTTDRIFTMVERIRQKTDIPMVFMTYANVVFSYGKGTEDFIRRGSGHRHERPDSPGCAL